MAVYKVSFVVSGSPHPGTIRNQDYRPVPGEVVRIGDALVEVVEVLDRFRQEVDFTTSMQPAGLFNQRKLKSITKGSRCLV